LRTTFPELARLPRLPQDDSAASLVLDPFVVEWHRMKECDMKRQPRIIDMESWPRREHYEFFKSYPVPFFSMTTSVDVAPLRGMLKMRDVSFTIGLLHVLTRAANDVPQFRQRIREGGAIEHERVHPGVTVLCEGDVFRFSILTYFDSLDRFASDASEAMKMTRNGTPLLPEAFFEEGRPRDDLLYCTSLPWFSFSGMFHPVGPDSMDSAPRIAWGRFEEKDGKLAMPLNVQAHHALIDGVHLAKFFKRVEELIRSAETTI
jgi:chloramphenicol O-acetyltransferase type A